MTELAFPANHLERVNARRCGPTPFFAESARRLSDRLADTKRGFPSILNISADAGATQALHPTADNRPTSNAYHLLLANLTLTTQDDPVTTFYKHLQHLAPDGLFLASTLGATSFAEFRNAFHAAGLPATARTTPLPDVQECGTLLQRLKLALPVVDRDLITLTFPDFPTLYRFLRAHGSHNWHPARSPHLLTPRQLSAMEAAYRTLHPRTDGLIPLTLELIYLHGWQPHASQQQPLSPGQGKISLVKILSS
ncbi:MAG: hypothetical protein H6922_01780 [Pseudomonadaceae bacterium]|nr:hypothetical protein [Pseudomonadaceae bacterium]